MATTVKKRMHTPTQGMVAASKRGLKMLKDGHVKESDIADISLKSGRKIASGQQISDDHVRSIAAYHSAHVNPWALSTDTREGGRFGCPGGDAEGMEHCDDLMWGGPAGASWAAARCAAMDATILADDLDAPDLATLMSGDSDFSLEIFSRGDLLRENLAMEKDQNGLIWAPIIRSGTLAMRPDPKSPTGKKADPLVFVKGHSTDPSKEIGLLDLYDSFNEGAVEHVTIPQTHANTTLENTGKIVKLKVADSTVRPGEKVLLAGHKFTEPDVEGKVMRGSVISRSCGILHGYVNQETGKRYPHVIEHVALTNKPWVTGMEPYGADAFSRDRDVVPMMLSEETVLPTVADDPAVLPPLVFSTRDFDEEKLRLELADVMWDDQDDSQPSLSAVQLQLGRALREMGSSPFYDEDSIYFEVRDVRPDSALVHVDYGGSDPMDAWVIPFTWDRGKLVLSDFSQWRVGHKAYVADADAEQDKQEVSQILQGMQLSADDLGDVRTYLSVNQATRDKAVAAGHALKDGSYPITNAQQLRAAAVLAASGHGDVKAARALIQRRAKELGVDVFTLPGFHKEPGEKSTEASLPEDPLARAQVLRLSQEPPQPQQGETQMGITPDLLDRLNLDANSRELLQKAINEDASDQAELARLRQERKVSGVKERLTKLSQMGFADCPGFLREVERILLADDEKPAARLDLSAEGKGVVLLSVTDVLDRLIGALPVDGGKLDLSAKASLLENPLSRRPDLTPNKDDGAAAEQTGDSLLAWMKDAAPEAVKAMEDGTWLSDSMGNIEGATLQLGRS